MAGRERLANVGDRLDQPVPLWDRLSAAGPHQAMSLLSCMCMNLVKSVSQSTLAKWGASSLPRQHTAHASWEVSSRLSPDHGAPCAGACVRDAAAGGVGRLHEPVVL